jgi:phosphoadenosine phosphosulfate reductase
MLEEYFLAEENNAFVFQERSKIDVAISRLREFEPKEGYILAFSGGKDSVAIYFLAKAAGVKFAAYYSQTSVDPPELVRFIKRNFKDVIILSYPKHKNGTTLTMWNLIEMKCMPPTRAVRYCCDYLKERVGKKGDTVIVGVRWSESSKRKKQSMVNFWKGKIVVRPIVDWHEDDVWTYIKEHNLPYCELYDEPNVKRLGCIACCMNPATQERELRRYPKYRALYIRAFEKMIINRHKKGLACEWTTGEEVMQWWLGKCKKDKTLPGQCSLF